MNRYSISYGIRGLDKMSAIGYSNKRICRERVVYRSYEALFNGVDICETVLMNVKMKRMA